MNARANYIISAQDATRDAIRSIQSNFKSLDSGIKTTARGINLALGFLAGAGLKNAFRSVLDATAEAAGSQSGFAKALEETKAAARNLLASKDGLPGATNALRALTETLKDPEVVRTFDSVATGIIRIGVAVGQLAANYAKLISEGWKGWKIMITGEGDDPIVNADTEVRQAAAAVQALQRGGGSAESRRRLASRQRDLSIAQMQYDGLKAFPKDPLQPIDASHAWDMFNKQFDDMERKNEAAVAAAAELAKTQKELGEFSEKATGQLGEFLGEQFQENQKALFDAQQAQRELFDDAQKGIAEQEKRTAEWRERMAEENKRAARESTEAWKGLFLDVMEDGFKGLSRDWKRLLKEMAAEALASGVLSWIKGGSFAGGFSSGLNGFLGGVGKLFGFANGGSILPGGSGGTDSQVVAFRKSPAERVDIYTPGQRGGGIVIAPVFNVDARGATEDAAKQFKRMLPAFAAQVAQMAKASLNDDISRGSLA